MGLVYDVYYYDARTGKLLKEFDRGSSGRRRAPEGEVAHCVCTNWSPEESYWVDDRGNVLSGPPWSREAPAKPRVR